MGAAADSSSLAAGFVLFSPAVNLHPEPYQTAAPQTHGVSLGAPLLSIWSIRSTRSISKRHTAAARKPPLLSNRHTPPAYHHPRQTRQRHRPPGLSRGLPRRSPSGRRRAPHFVRQVRQVRQVRHPRHAPAARKPPLLSNRHTPAVNLHPEPYQTAACKPTGYTMAPQSLSYRSYRSYKSYASATPPRPANRRCHQTGTPRRHICTRPKPDSGTANSRGIPRRPTLSDRSDRSDRSDTSATPPPPANRRCYQTGIPLRHICPLAPHPTAAQQTHGVYNGAPIIIL